VGQVGGHLQHPALESRLVGYGPLTREKADKGMLV
jgi:hypothetical protein